MKRTKMLCLTTTTTTNERNVRDANMARMHVTIKQSEKQQQSYWYYIMVFTKFLVLNTLQLLISLVSLPTDDKLEGTELGITFVCAF
jgi:hypothetical protein